MGGQDCHEESLWLQIFDFEASFLLSAIHVLLVFVAHHKEIANGEGILRGHFHLMERDMGTSQLSPAYDPSACPDSRLFLRWPITTLTRLKSHRNVLVFVTGNPGSPFTHILKPFIADG